MIANTILHGDALAILQTLPDACVQCVVTSPPYFGLRDYGVAGQIGLEETPAVFIEKLVQVFREVRRVLRPDGTLWLNIGDTYAGGRIGRDDSGKGGKFAGPHMGTGTKDRAIAGGFKSKDLMMIPARLAIALQDDGWWLRSDVIWSKPNAMPESVTDRPSTAHEHIFLLAKRETYYYDADAVREPTPNIGLKTKNSTRLPPLEGDHGTMGHDGNGMRMHTVYNNPAGRNKRTVWTVSTEAFSQAHFATMPTKLVEPCIFAGTSPQACEHCGAPWQRLTKKTEPIKMAGPNHAKAIQGQGQLSPIGQTSMLRSGLVCGRETTRWEPTCSCASNTGAGKCIVLDPFCGAGTTALVALQLRRDYLGIELNEEYIKLARSRIAVVQPRLWIDGSEGVA